MGNPQHLEWLLEGVEAWNARRKRAPFTPDLSGFDLSGDEFRVIDSFFRTDRVPDRPFAKENWRAINLSEANLTDTNFQQRVLFGANFRSSNLARCNFNKTKAYSANFDDCNLKGANLNSADLYGSKLFGADMSGANINGATLRDAQMRGAIVRSSRDDQGKLIVTDLSNAKWLYQRQMNIMQGDLGTLFPSRLTRPSS